ncbi:MAG TPA: NAD(P)H-dependent glycerol-3-phosphate dehydrogenase [Candidatus Binataceae bacterium]|nr:NAD(P)H-dependent glycerol-3-phosphate dehydrogenase [Candidatus Binataceae bacterium]
MAGSVVILGAGAWGSALAITLARGGHDVTLCPRRIGHCADLKDAGENSAYLPGVMLPASLRLSADWPSALHEAGIVVMAIPSRYARATLAPVAEAIPRAATIVSVTKGIERESLMTMTQMIADLTGRETGIAALSGPGFAAEIARGKPAALVAAAHDDRIAADVRDQFAVRPLRVYSSNDVVGVELGGTVKNIIAIAAGISDGLELGSSARAALITRGLAEMRRLAIAAGARRETLSGLAGLGDMILTCCGELSRNRALGLAIARGQPPTPLESAHPVAEGMVNAQAISALAERLHVEVPIVAAINRILYEGAPIIAMIDELLSRQLKAEF